MVFQNNVLSGAGGSGTTVHTIDQSIRFNSADSAYMHRTPSSSGNRKTFTSSFWVKFGDLTDCALPFPSVLQNANYGAFLSSGIIQFFIYYSGSWQGQLYTNRVFRDPAAWYHFVIVVDTTNATPTERVRIYVNGQRETSFSTENYPNQNQDTDWNNSGEKMGIGVSANGFSGSFGEYYAAEMVFIDGTAYGPENFGEYNSSGIWIPKDVSGLSFGTNGFHIDGRDSSDLGDDESGQGNDFTVVNLASNDQMSDSPTTNWCVMSPLLNNGCTYTNGNLEVAPPNLQSTHRLVLPTMGILPSDTNKYYWEITYLASDNSSSVNMLGVAGLDRGDNPASATLNGDGDGYGLGYNTSTSNIYAGGNWTANGSPTWSGGFTAGAIYGVAYDGSTKRLYFYENNSALNSGNHFATYTGSAPLGPGASMYVSPSSSKLIFNMGANGFTYTPPTGYVAVNTTNLGS